MAGGGRTGNRGLALLIGAAVLVVAVAAWAITRDAGGSAGRAATGGPTARQESTEPQLEVELTRSAAEQQRSAAPPEATPVPASAPIDAGGLTLEEPLEEGVPLVVLRGATSQPVPFAVVSIGDVHHYEARSGFLLGPKAYTKSVGTLRHYRADAEGLVLVPRPKWFASAFATTEDGWGFLTFRVDEVVDPLMLRVYPDSDVVVRVVDHETLAPVAGVEVQLLWDLGEEDIEEMDTEVTDEDGLATFPHLRQHLEGYWAHTERILVALAGALPDTEMVQIDTNDVPELIELRTEPFVAVDVTLVDRDGKPYTEPVWVTLLDETRQKMDSRNRSKRGTETGSVSFEQLRPGLALTATVRSFTGASAEPREFVTPATPGARLPVTLVMGPPRPSLTGRLLHRDGSPVANEEVRASLRIVGMPQGYAATAATDSEGAFQMRPSDRALRGERNEVSFSLETDGAPLGAKVEFPGPVRADVPLGDVHLTETPAVAAGRVTDELGAPIEGAKISISSVVELNGRRSYHTLTSLRTEADGTFTAYGVATTELISVLARHVEYGRAERIIVAAGTQNLHLTLPAGGRVVGNVLLDEEWYCDFAVVTARRSGEEEWMQDAWLDRPGLFEMNSLEPGLWSFLARVETEEQGVLIEDVEVRAGETTRDPRLVDIDLRGKARVIHFNVVDENGEPIERGRASHRPAGGTQWERGSSFSDGECNLFTSLDRVELYVAAQGRRSEFVPAVKDGDTITLGPGIPIRFTWDGEAPEKVGPKSVTISVMSGDPQKPDRQPNAYVSDDPDTVLYYPRAGSYEVIWFARYRVNGRQLSEEIVRTSFSILDRSEPQTVALRVPAEVRQRIETWKAEMGK